MTILTPPIQAVPIGKATFNGKSVDVMIHPEYLRFLSFLTQRVGGISGTDTEDIEAIAEAALDQADSVSQAPGESKHAPAEVEDHSPALRASVEELARRVDALEQGVSL